LTTGAITGVIDRLEKAGLVRRVRDEARRKVFITSVRENTAKIARFNIVERFAYLNDVLHRMSNGHPMNRLDHLLPETGCRQTPQPDPMCQEWTLTRIGTRCWR
jgi:hypothetical protein